MRRASTAALLLTALLLGATLAGAPARAQGEGLPWITQPSQALNEARDSHRLWVMNFFSPTCPHCQAMSRDCWSSSRVAALSDTFVFQAVESGKVPSMYRTYEVRSYPTVVVADFTGREIVRVVGNPGGEYLITLLERLAKEGERINEIGARLDTKRNDPYAHADLARWYGEMQMYAQALPSWSKALRYGNQSVPEEELDQWLQAAQAAETASKAGSNP